MNVVHEPIAVASFDGIRIRNHRVAVDVLPPVGGKLISLTDVETGHEYLSLPDRTSAYRLPEYGGDFGKYDISGWDECFPAIGEGPYPAAPWQGIDIPDHGELWTLPWRAEATEAGVDMSAAGVRFPYRFHRSLQLDDDGVTLDYRVVNTAAQEFPCFWSAHPLLAATPSTRIYIPAEIMRVQLSMSGRLGECLTEHEWPTTVDRSGRRVALDVMGPSGVGEADKLYSNAVTEGWAALHDEESDQWLAFLFDPSDVPFVGYWANRSGWPEDRPSFNIALEPCSGYPDRLDVADERGARISIPPRGERRWQVRIRVGRGSGSLEETIGHPLPGS